MIKVKHLNSLCLSELTIMIVELQKTEHVSVHKEFSF